MERNRIFYECYSNYEKIKTSEDSQDDRNKYQFVDGIVLMFVYLTQVAIILLVCCKATIFRYDLDFFTNMYCLRMSF